MKVIVDPRIFDQIAQLPRADAIKELQSLEQLATASYIPKDYGTKARTERKRLESLND
mgnify:FL=1